MIYCGLLCNQELPSVDSLYVEGLATQAGNGYAAADAPWVPLTVITGVDPWRGVWRLLHPPDIVDDLRSFEPGSRWLDRTLRNLQNFLQEKFTDPQGEQTMKLYYHPLSGYSQKVLIALYEKNISFDGEIIELMDPQAKAAYKKDVYPIGKVPFMIADDGHKVPESSMIIEYLENNYSSGTQLIPSDKHLARQVRFHDRMADLYFQNQIGIIFFDSLKPKDQQDPESVQQARNTIDTVYGFLNQHLGSGEWMVGNHFSMAECAMAPALNYARQTHPYEQHQNIKAYWNRIHERPSVKRVLDEAAPYMEAFMKSMG